MPPLDAFPFPSPSWFLSGGVGRSEALSRTHKNAPSLGFLFFFPSSGSERSPQRNARYASHFLQTKIPSRMQPCLRSSFVQPFFFFSLLFSSAPLKVTENPSCTKDSLPLVRFLHKKRVCPDSLAVLSGIKKTERERKSHKHNVHKSTIFCELRSTVPGAAVLATAKYIYTHVGSARRVLTQSDIKCFSSLQWRSVHTPVVFFSFLPAGFFSRPESLGHRR